MSDKTKDGTVKAHNTAGFVTIAEDEDGPKSTADMDHGDKLDVEKNDEKADKDPTPLQMRDVDEDAMPDPSKEGRGYVVSGIDPAHVQQDGTQDNAPKGTLPGV